MITIPVGAGSVTAWETPAHGSPQAGLLLAHGAGTRGDHPSLVALGEALAEQRFQILRFNFPYTEHGHRAPDPEATLLGTWRSVLGWARAQAGWRDLTLVAGGRSMGGRMASLAAAKGDFDPAGLVFYAYPLHPPGREDRLRFEHLPRVGVPMLFVSGTRDSMARRELLEEALAKLGEKASVHWIEDADHGFAVPKRTGLTKVQVNEMAARATADWFVKKVEPR